MKTEVKLADAVLETITITYRKRPELKARRCAGCGAHFGVEDSDYGNGVLTARQVPPVTRVVGFQSQPVPFEAYVCSLSCAAAVVAHEKTETRRLEDVRVRVDGVVMEDALRKRWENNNGKPPRSDQVVTHFYVDRD